MENLRINYSKKIVSSVLDLDLDLSCPWPRDGLSSKSRSLALNIFCSRNLENVTFACFSDLETVYDRFSQGELWRVLQE